LPADDRFARTAAKVAPGAIDVNVLRVAAAREGAWQKCPTRAIEGALTADKLAELRETDLARGV